MALKSLLQGTQLAFQVKATAKSSQYVLTSPWVLLYTTDEGLWKSYPASVIAFNLTKLIIY